MSLHLRGSRKINTTVPKNSVRQIFKKKKKDAKNKTKPNSMV
jgi:hypothetical protein